jgi:hypothetical protein
MVMKSSPIGIKTILMVILVLTFLIPINVFAKSPLYISFKPGVYFPQSNDLESFDTGFSGDIAFGFRFSPYIAAEFGVGYFNTEGEVTYMGREEFDLDVFPITLTLKAILPYKKWEFFGLGGAGVYIVSGPFDADDDYYDYYYDHYYYYYDHYYYDHYDYDYDAVFGGYLGAGIHYNITPTIFVGVEGKYLWTDKVNGDEVFGIPLETKFKMNGIIANAVFGIRF